MLLILPQHLPEPLDLLSKKCISKSDCATVVQRALEEGTIEFRHTFGTITGHCNRKDVPLDRFCRELVWLGRSLCDILKQSYLTGTYRNNGSTL
jgi:hypothetical protein